MPHGKPVILYSMPEIFFTKDYLKAVDPRDVELCKSGCIFREGPTCDSELFELLIIYMEENQLAPPSTAQEGIDLYYTLRPLVLHDLND